MAEALKPTDTHLPGRRFYLLALSAGILACFTASWLLAKHIVTDAPAEASAAGRIFATSLLFWVIVALRPEHRVPWARIRVRWRGVVVLGLLGFVLYSLLTFLALTVLDASELGMTLALIPGFTYLLGLAFFGDRLHPLKLTGVPLATGAALYFTTDGFRALGLDGAMAGEQIAGVLAATGAAVSYALYGLVYKRIMVDLPIAGVLAWVTLAAFVLFLPYLALVDASLRTMDLATIASLLLLGAGLSAPVFLMYHAVIVSGGVLYANSVGILSPFAILLAEWALGQRGGLSVGEGVSMACCALGVALIFSHAARASGTGRSPQAAVGMATMDKRGSGDG